MALSDKKQLKAAAKAQKKQTKAQLKANKALSELKRTIVAKPPAPSGAVRFAEAVRGILFMIFAISLVIAIILSQSGYTITTSDVIDSLISHIAGKIVLLVIAVAFFIYGLKYLRAIK